MFTYNRIQNTKETCTDIAEKRVDPPKINQNE